MELTKEQVWDGFVAAILHDIGKVAQYSTPPHISHEALEEISCQLDLEFPKTVISSKILGLIRRETRHMYQEGIAISLADQIGHEIQGYPSLEIGTNEALNRRLDDIQKNPIFYPFCDYPQSWDSDKKILTYQRICEGLKRADMQTLLQIQREQFYFPNKSYIPHLSQSLYHLFTAGVYYFIIQKAKGLTSWEDLNEFSFFVIEVYPNCGELFYRLRDIQLGQRFSRKLRHKLYEEIYKNFTELNGLDTNSNPFVFYGKEGLVCLHNQYETFREGVKKALGEAEGFLRSVNLKSTEFRLSISWNNNAPSVRLSQESPIRRNESIISPSFLLIDEYSLLRCELCQRPTSKEKLLEDDKGNAVCQACHKQRSKSSGIDLDKLSEKEGTEERVGFVFLTFPDDLFRHALEVAEDRLAPDFLAQKRLSPGLLEPVAPGRKTGLFEYLQALLELREFDNLLEKEIKKINLEEKSLCAASLFTLPALKVFVLREDKVWEFLDLLHVESLKIRLEMGLKVVLSDAKKPFWSHMERCAVHSLGEEFHDLSKEVIIVFTPEEVRDIRKLAELARSRRVWPTQIHNVSRVALNTTLEELELEIDVRSDRLQGIKDELKKSIEKITGEEYKDREKRAVFLKYVANLSKGR